MFKKVQICMTECILIRAQSVSDVGGWSWLLEHINLDSCQARVGDIKLRSVIVYCLHQFLAALEVSQYSFACRNHHILQLCILSWKTTQKTLTCFFHSRDNSSKAVPSTSSEPSDNRPPAKKGTQTSQESASTSQRPRSMKNVDWHGLSQAQRYWK